MAEMEEEAKMANEMMKKKVLIVSLMLLVTLLGSCIKSQTGSIRAVDIGIEGPEWQLLEISGMSVSPLPGERRPFIRFDGTKKQATGFAGCNNFFGGYELDGPSLKFGPIGATRMFCEGVSGEVEMRFMEALEQTRIWDRRDETLLLLKYGEVLARFAMDQGDEPGSDLESMTFLSTWFPSGKVTLSHGEYREAAAQGSASEILVKLNDKKAFGTVNGRETVAVVLVTDPGGSGTFYDLALLTKGAEGWMNTDTVFLGDRVKVHSVAFENDHIIAALTTHGPSDPMCCPTFKVKKRFVVLENRLVPAAEGKTGGKPEITGTVWQWVQTLYNDDRKNVPDKPENYTIQFLEDGRINVKADCNLKGGTYSVSPEEKHLSIDITHSTMAACPEGSREDEFVRGLSGAAMYFIKDGDLYIDLKYDSGTMKLLRKR